MRIARGDDATGFDDDSERSATHSSLVDGRRSAAVESSPSASAAGQGSFLKLVGFIRAPKKNSNRVSSSSPRSLLAVDERGNRELFGPDSQRQGAPHEMGRRGRGVRTGQVIDQAVYDIATEGTQITREFVGQPKAHPIHLRSQQVTHRR